MSTMINLILLVLFPINVPCKAIETLTKHNLPQNMSPLPTEMSDVFYGTVPVEGHQNKDYPDQQNHRYRRSSGKNSLVQLPKTWNYVRQFICGANNQNCLHDERINKFGPDILRQLSKVRDAPSPSDDTDWSPMKDIFMPPNYSSDVNILNSVNLSGRREVPLYVDEPRVVTFNDKDLFGSGNFDDPFIPMRGKKVKNFVDEDNSFERKFLLDGFQSNRPARMKWKRGSRNDAGGEGVIDRKLLENSWNNLNDMVSKTAVPSSMTAHIKNHIGMNQHATSVKWCCRDNIYRNFLSRLSAAADDDNDNDNDEDNVLTDSQRSRNQNNNLSQENRDSTFYLARGSQTHT